MNVLSLFDGMACGQIALRELSVPVKNYYAAEIDKFAIQQTPHNFPNTIQLGSVTDIKAKNLERIDLLIGGSPCQGFSFAGKQLNFSDPRSALFFEFVRLWNEVKAINPNAKFLLENVNMKKEYLRVISEYMGVFPVRINSNLVSAQNRDRWYWTNIRTKDVGLFSEQWSDIPEPEDRGILLKDVLESEVDSKYYLSDKAVKSIVLNPDNLQKSNVNPNKSNPLLHPGHSGGVYKGMTCVAMRGREQSCMTPKRTEYGKSIRKDYEAGRIDERRANIQKLEPRDDNKTNCLTSVAKDNLLTNGYKLRRLTPTECARLQTIPEWYKWIVSDTQIYRMLGNGWTVEVIKHIFKHI